MNTRKLFITTLLAILFFGYTNVFAVVGDCCYNFGCVELTELDCFDLGGTWYPNSPGCDVICTTGTGSCCIQGQCVWTTTSICTVLMGGVWNGDGSTCATIQCTIPPTSGACCFGGGSCLLYNEATCSLAGGVWYGAGSSCDAGICNQPSCEGDIDNSGFVDVSDLLIVIADWGLPVSPADFNGDGTVDVTDLLIVIGAWGPC